MGNVTRSVVVALALSLLALGNARAETTADPEDPLEPLRRALRDDSYRTRRGAVRDAARIASPEAWELVIGALSDRESEVADEAQVQLGELPHAALLEELYRGRGLDSRADTVAERVAEALGRMPLEIDAERLGKQLSTRPGDRERTRLLLWSLERQAQAQRLVGDRSRAARAVRTLVTRRRDPALRAQALLALERLDPEAAGPLLLDAAGAREPELRCAALVSAARRSSSGASERLALARTRGTDEERGVRAAALDVLAELGTRGAVEALVDRLEVEPSQRLRERALAYLRRGTGMKYRFDPRPWRDWIAQQEPGWTAGTAMSPGAGWKADAERAGADGNSRARSLAGFPIRSDRVAFLFDFSGSMWTELEDGRLPKDVVAVELRAALEALPETTHFNLIPFAYEPLPWRSELVPATPRNVQAALDFFEGCGARGRGNFYDAALLSFDDPAVDTIVVLTDGVPTGGTHNHMDLIVPLLLHRNRLRGVAIDVLLVDAPYRAQRKWEELARRSGGTALEVRLEAP